MDANPTALRTISAFGILGPPIATISLFLLLSMTAEGSSLDVLMSFADGILIWILFAYCWGVIPALCTGTAFHFVQKLRPINAIVTRTGAAALIGGVASGLWALAMPIPIWPWLIACGAIAAALVAALLSSKTMLSTKQWSRRGETNAPFVHVIAPRGSLLSLGF